MIIRPTYIAHRGIWRHSAVENSLQAIDKAFINQNCDGCEIDLQVINGQWVGFHDSNFNRVAQRKYGLNHLNQQTELIQNGHSDPLLLSKDLCRWLVNQQHNEKPFIINIELKHYAKTPLSKSLVCELIDQIALATSSNTFKVFYSSFNQHVLDIILAHTKASIGYLFKTFTDLKNTIIPKDKLDRIEAITIRHNSDDSFDAIDYIDKEFGRLAGVYFKDTTDFIQTFTQYNQQPKVKMIFCEYGVSII